jgi:hypothetical protein
MAAKKQSALGPKVRLLLEEALLEALKRHLNGKSASSRGKKKAPAHKKKAAKKKAAAGKKKPSRRQPKKRAGKRWA